MKKILIDCLGYFGFAIKITNNNGSKKYLATSDKENLSFYITPTGKYYLPKNIKRDSVANAIKAGQIFEEEIIEVAKLFLKPNASIFDIGANYGQMTVVLSKALQQIGTGKVFSFEAEPFVGEILSNNVSANDCKNVQLVLNAVHHTSGLKLIFPEPDLKKFGALGSYGIDPKAIAGRAVETIAIDDLKIEAEISFIKVDVQGSDLFALQGARNTIMKNKPAIIFEFEEQFQNDFKTSFQDYVDFINSINYKFVRTYMSINFLAIPKD